MFKATSFATTLSIAALVALGPLSTDMYLPALPGMASEFDTDSGNIQLTLSLFMVGFAFAQIIYGPLSDRFGRKPVLLIGLLIFIISSIGCALSSSINTLLLFRFLQALGGSAGPVLGRAMVRDIHGPESSGKILSHIASAMALAPAVAPIAGGFMFIAWGWASIFWLLVSFGIAETLLLYFKIEESAPQEFRHPKSINTILSNYKTLLKDRNYLGYTLTCTLSFAGLFSYLSGSSFVIIDYFSVSEVGYGLLFSLVVIGYISGTLTGGKLSLSWGYKNLVALGSIICLFSGLLMLILTGLNTQHVASIVIPMMFFMMGVGLVMPQSMAGALANYPQMAGSASGMLGFIQMSIAGIAGIIVGHGYNGTPLIMSIMIAFMGFLTLFFYYYLIQQD